MTFKRVCATKLIQVMLLVVMFMLSSVSAVFAQALDEVCQLSVIKEAFKGYLQMVDQAQVEKIQTLLNDKAYGSVDVDGVLGQETREALQKVCQAYALKSSDNLAVNLVALLEGDVQPIPAVPAQAVEPEKVSMPLKKNSNLEKNIELPANLTQDKKSEKINSQISSAPTKKIDNSLAYYRWMTPEDDKQFFGHECAKIDIDNFGPEAELPKDVLEKLVNIEGIPYPNEILFNSALKKLFENSDVVWQPYLCLIKKQAYQVPSARIEKIELNADGCGCSREFSSKVFGFYPAWLATGEAQTVDFSLFDRLVYYSLDLNQDGNIEGAQRWSEDSNIAAFINEAYKHYVDVDVSINVFGWQSWTEQTMNTAILRVASIVKKKFEITDGGIQIDPQLILNGTSVHADGVVLNFKNYSDYEQDRHKIVTFVTKLAEALGHSRGSEIALNVMLDVDFDTIDAEALLTDLEVVMIDDGDNVAPIDHVLMFLQESTSKNKKNLRRKIEDEFRGAHRRDVMRKIIPVISPLGHQYDVQNEKVVPFAQFKDDLIYFQDNFSGVGLWPLPLDTDPDFDTIKQYIIELYGTEKSNNLLRELTSDYVPQLCQFACPNRWLFRLLFDVLLGLFVIYLVAAIWINYLRVLYRRYFLYFVAYSLLILLVVLISLACDPYWQKRADVVVAGIFISGIVVWVTKYVSKAKRPPLP